MNRLELRVGRCLADAGLQFNGRSVVGAMRFLQFQRQINLAALPSEARRHHTDDGVRFVEQPQRVAQDVVAAVVVSLPEFIAQHHHRLGILSIRHVGRNQRASEQRRHPQLSSRVRRHVNGFHIFGKLLVGSGQAPFVDGHDAIEATYLAELLDLAS